MDRSLKLLLPLTSAMAMVCMTGCHLIGMSERYGDVIDCVSDKQLTLDRFYRRRLDLTKIGQDRQHQCEFAQHTAIYPDTSYLLSVPSESKIPEAPPAEVVPAPETMDQAPIPPVPPAAKLPAIDSSSLKQLPANPSVDNNPVNMDVSAVLGVGGFESKKVVADKTDDQPIIQRVSAQRVQVSQPAAEAVARPFPVSTPASIPPAR